MPPESVLRGPTTATLRLIEQLLADAAVPLSRYEIRVRLGNRVGPGLLNAALDYLADHEMVFDEGPGGKVLWIRTSGRTSKRLAAT